MLSKAYKTKINSWLNIIFFQRNFKDIEGVKFHETKYINRVSNLNPVIDCRKRREFTFKTLK